MQTEVKSKKTKHRRSKQTSDENQLRGSCLNGAVGDGGFIDEQSSGRRFSFGIRREHNLLQQDRHFLQILLPVSLLVQASLQIRDACIFSWWVINLFAHILL